MVRWLVLTICLTSFAMAGDLYEVSLEPVDCRVTLTVTSGQSGKGEIFSIQKISASTTKDITSTVNGFERGFQINAMVFADKPGARVKITYLKNKNIVSENSYSDFPSGGQFIGGWRSSIQLICAK